MAATITATMGGFAVGSHTSMASNRPLLKASVKVNSELGFVTSQLGGIKISCVSSGFKLPPTTLSAPFRPSLQPVARNFLTPLFVLALCSLFVFFVFPLNLWFFCIDCFVSLVFIFPWMPNSFSLFGGWGFLIASLLEVCFLI